MARLFVVFSRTKCRMGSFVRVCTHEYYNHVSVALDDRFDEVYSFARLKRKTPLCGGFVREGAERFRSEDGIAEIAVCAVEIEDENMPAVRELLSDMALRHERYIYNVLSAMCAPVRLAVRVPDSYTCVEFALLVLRKAGIEVQKRFYSVDDLYELLRPGEIYRGQYPETAAVADLTYDDDVPMHSCLFGSVRQIWRAAYRFVAR